MPQFHNFKNKRVLLLVIVMTAFFMGKTYYDIRSDRKLTIQAAERQAKGLANALNEHAVRTFNNAESTLDYVIQKINATSPGGHPDEKTVYEILHSYKRSGSFFTSLYVASPNARLYATSTEYPVRYLNLTEREFFRHHSGTPDPGLFISSPFKSRLTDRSTISITKRLANPDGSLRMIVGMTIDPGYFSGFYGSLGLGSRDRILLIRNDGAVLSQQPFSEKIANADFKNSRLFSRELPKAPLAGTFRVEEAVVDKTARIVSYRSSSDYPMISVVSLLEEDVLERWWLRTIKSSGGATFIILLVGALGAVVYRQVNELKNANDRLSQQQLELSDTKKRYQDMVNSIDGIVWEVDLASCRFTFISERALEITGYPAARCLTDLKFWAERIHPDDRSWEAYYCLNENGEKGDNVFEYRFRKEDGTYIWLRDIVTVVTENDRPARLRGVMLDVTDRRHLEEQLRHSQKLEAIGTLAGGIAHDFNNILTAIIGYGNLLQMKMAEDDKLRSNVDKILMSANRAATLTQGLLAYSRKESLNLRPVDLNDIVMKVDQLLSRIIGEDIELKVIPADRQLTVLADAGQIEMVIMNLATNARDAMPRGGSLLIGAKETEIDAGFVAAHGYGTPGHYVMLTVSDTGNGMDEATRERIFEPFFSTKGVGKGTGLGLAIAYGTVKQHKGFINVYSEPGKGTVFRIYIPLTGLEPEEDRRITRFPEKGNGETILLVEDSEEIRSFLRELLTEYGYRIIEAADGVEGVEKFLSHQDSIDLLLLDVIMPRKNGKDAFAEIRTVRPEVKALFMSGYTADIISRKGIDTEGLEFVAKPLSPHTLLTKIREVLERQRVESANSLDLPPGAQR